MKNLSEFHRIVAMGFDDYLMDPEWLAMETELNEKGERVRKKKAKPVNS